MFESNAIGLEDEYVCLVIIGDEIGVMSEIQGIGNHNTVINKLQTDNMF